jgi:SnoaL-like domain
MDDADRLALHELPGRYGDLIDDKDWPGLAVIFVPEATFEINGKLLDGLDAIRHHMAEVAQHPRAHHMTNIWAQQSDDGVVLHSRVIAVRSDGTVSSGRYRDDVVRTPGGWRVVRRVFASVDLPGRRPPR